MINNESQFLLGVCLKPKASENEGKGGITHAFSARLHYVLTMAALSHRFLQLGYIVTSSVVIHIAQNEQNKIAGIIYFSARRGGNL